MTYLQELMVGIPGLLTGYLQTIIWTILFVVIVEMVFPSSDIKRYLKLVLGFIVIYTILSPIVQLVTKTPFVPGDNIWQYIGYYQNELGQEVAYGSYEEEIEKQKAGMLAIYTAQLEEQTKKRVEQQLEVEVLAVEATTYLDEGQYSVEGVNLEVAYAHDTDGFGVGIGSKSESIVLDRDQLEKQIKNCLKDFYNWDNTNIYITVQEN